MHNVKTSWEKIVGPRQYYITLEKNKIVVGSQLLNPITDLADSCSHKDFLRGKLQDIVSSQFGNDILEEVIDSVKKYPKKE